MTIEVFMAMLLVASVVNSLVTEAIKKALNNSEKSYSSNLIVGIVAVIVGGIMCYWHSAYTTSAVNEILILSYISFVAASWVAAMIGYDKVVQAITQLTKK